MIPDPDLKRGTIACVPINFFSQIITTVSTNKQYYLKLLLSSLFHLVGIDEGEVKGAGLVVVNQLLKSLGGWSDLQVDLRKKSSHLETLKHKMETSKADKII